VDEAFKLAPPTIRDVAARAGVALSSVSRALSGHASVSAGMRKKVEDAARELGYEPDLLAQSMRSGSTNTVGFLLRDISNPLFANIARHCEQELRRVGFSMILMNSDGVESAEAFNLNMMRRRRVDGVIASLVSETSPTTVAALMALKMPIVLLDREVAGLDSAAALCDHYSGVRNAVDALLVRGHRRIVLITGPVTVRTSRERVRAYCDAFAQRGLPVDESLVMASSFDADYSKSQATELLSRELPPTAVIAGGIATTAGVLAAMHQLQLKPGSDIALVALDEWPMFEIFTPQLASVARDSGEMGTTSARLLLDMLSGMKPRTVIIDTVFTPRESITTISGR